jgi:hypothetical protein
MKNNREKPNQEKFLSEFQYDRASGIYVFPGKELHTIDYSDGIKTENFILKTIKNSKNISDDSSELMLQVKDWPSFYHMGIGRSNILKALALPFNAKVLELGSGCGAVSRYLGENFKFVDSVEGSSLRAKITRERCRDLKNVKIFCSNFRHIKFDIDYDVITLIGVSEYAPVYFADKQNAKESFLTLLKIAKNALKESGSLIIAIENKIGIKYWSGCPEDHTGKIFDGIHGYPFDRGPITFSKKEIEALLEEGGFSYNSFYYCFPDYKFASTIISDVGDEKKFYLHNWIELPFTSYDATRIYTFHEGLALKTLTESKLLREFANSFLIVARKNDSLASRKPYWIAKKFSMRRHKEFRCVTELKIKPEISIKKRRLEGTDREYSIFNDTIKIKHKVNDSVWCEGDLVVFEIFRAMYKTNFKNKILELLQTYYQELIRQYHTGVYDEKGYPVLKGTLIDFTFRNIVRKEEEFLCLDNEWWIENISADYMMYRCIKIDIIELQKPWVMKKIGNADKFIIELIKHFFPKYGTARHNRNKKLEEVIQNLVSGGLFSSRLSRKFRFLNNQIIWNIVKVVWNKLPKKMKGKIKEFIK